LIQFVLLVVAGSKAFFTTSTSLSLLQITEAYANEKNNENNSSGVHSDLELDSNHNQLNGKAVVDLMVKGNKEIGAFSVS